MGKENKTKYSNAGKGDKSRVSNKKKFDDNWDKIFGKKNEKKQNQLLPRVVFWSIVEHVKKGEKHEIK